LLWPLRVPDPSVLRVGLHAKWQPPLPRGCWRPLHLQCCQEV
jgi:hypothetical protein